MFADSAGHHYETLGAHAERKAADDRIRDVALIAASMSGGVITLGSVAAFRSARS